VLIELISLGVTVEALYERMSIGNRRFWKGGGSVTFTYRRGHPQQPFLHG